MANFKFVISDKGNSYQIERDQRDAPVIGKKIGDEFPGDFLGLDGYTLKVTGGSDKDGFPMRVDIEGLMRRRIIITKGIGFSGKKRKKKGKYEIKGLRRRRMLRGNSVAGDIAQINCKITKHGSKQIEEILGKKTEDKQSDAQNASSSKEGV